MIIYHLEELIKKKEAIEKRRVSDTEIAEALKITRQTVANIKNNHIKTYITTTRVIEQMLQYFDCEKINDFIEYIPDKK